MKIHLIERDSRITREDKSTQDWESGYWVVAKDVADALVGGDIYFHKAQDKPSYFGGTITDYKYEEGGEWDGKVVFSFTATMEHKNVKTAKSGWGMERKLDRE